MTCGYGVAYYIEAYRYFGKDVKDDGQDGLVNPDPLAPEPFPEVLRHGVDPRGHVDGHEQPAQHQDEENSLAVRTSSYMGFKDSQARGANLGSFGLCTFYLATSALDHKVYEPPFALPLVKLGIAQIEYVIGKVWNSKCRNSGVCKV